MWITVKYQKEFGTKLIFYYTKQSQITFPTTSEWQGQNKSILKVSKTVNLCLLEVVWFFVIPFLSIDFFSKRMKPPNLGQYICGPDKESDKQSHDKWYLREGYQISCWLLWNFHVENKCYKKKERHEKITNISGTWGKRGCWGSATVVFETTLKVIFFPC